MKFSEKYKEIKESENKKIFFNLPYLIKNSQQVPNKYNRDYREFVELGKIRNQDKLDKIRNEIEEIRKDFLNYLSKKEKTPTEKEMNNEWLNFIKEVNK